jgi:hypothetical protein
VMTDAVLLLGALVIVMGVVLGVLLIWGRR